MDLKFYPSATSSFQQPTGGFLSIGNFDGVHRGHQVMLHRLVENARRAGAAAMVATFDPHPLALLRPSGAPPRLTTLPARIELLHQQNVDLVIVLPTTTQLLHLTADEFFQDVILRQIQARGLVEGPNFCFGHDRGGNITLLRQMCHHAGLTLDVVEAVTCHDQWVSSSVIRSLLQAGDLDDAVALLGHPYRLTGEVVSGARRGTGLGFPTANIEHVQTVIPGAGVYAARCVIAEKTYATAVNIGPNPTFGENALKVEAHLLDFRGDLYGSQLSLDLVRRIRDIQRFHSPQELQAQIVQDIVEIRKAAAGGD